MAEMIRKTFRAIVKNVDDKEGIIDMLIPMSAETWDRDGDIVKASAFKKTIKEFMKRPILVSSHEYRQLTHQIGEFVKMRIKEGEGLLGSPKYYKNMGNPEADWGYQLASMGMAAYSIGFIPIAFDEGDGVKAPRRTYTDVELLEISHVIVPSNRDAIQSLRDAPDTDLIVKQLANEVLDHPSLITKPEETDDYIRIPVRECTITATINISAKEGIKALYCGEDKKVATYLFAKDKGWTMEKAKAWVKEHDESKEAPELIIEPKSISQGIIRDEIDYLNELLAEQVDDKTKTMLLELAHKIDSLCITKQEALPQPVVKVESAPQQIETLDYDELVALARKMGEDVATKIKG